MPLSGEILFVYESTDSFALMIDWFSPHYE